MGLDGLDDLGTTGDHHLAVHATLPADGFETRPGSYEFGDELMATRSGLKPYHRCPHCNGYVAGHPGERGENSIGPLCGRCGTSYHCRRCGWELAFSGIMS